MFEHFVVGEHEIGLSCSIPFQRLQILFIMRWVEVRARHQSKVACTIHLQDSSLTHPDAQLDISFESAGLKLPYGSLVIQSCQTVDLQLCRAPTLVANLVSAPASLITGFAVVCRVESQSLPTVGEIESDVLALLIIIGGK